MARGGLIEETALLEAMKDGRLGARWHLNEVPDLLVDAAHGVLQRRDKMRKAALEVKRVLQGGAPRNCVNKQWMKS